METGLDILSRCFLTLPNYVASLVLIAAYGEFEIPGQGTSAGPLWTVFAPDGHVLGFVETPPGLHIYEIGADHILGHATDEDGIEYVQLWPLDRTSPEE